NHYPPRSCWTGGPVPHILARMLDAGAQLRLLALSVIVLGACDGGPAPDGGPVELDAGTDAGQLEEDAGPDAGEPGDCQGPPGLYMPGSCEVLAVGVRA